MLSRLCAAILAMSATLLLLLVYPSIREGLIDLERTTADHGYWWASEVQMPNALRFVRRVLPSSEQAAWLIALLVGAAAAFPKARQSPSPLVLLLCLQITMIAIFFFAVSKTFGKHFSLLNGDTPLTTQEIAVDVAWCVAALCYCAPAMARLKRDKTVTTIAGETEPQTKRVE